MSALGDAPNPEHLPGLAGANIIATNGLRMVEHAIGQLHEVGGVIVIDGEPGVGKTFAVQHVLSALSVRVHWTDMPDTPKGKEANVRIYRAVTGRTPPARMTEFALTDETVDVLNGLRAVLVIDEAQNMTRSALRQVRYLHGRPTTKALVVLIGSKAVDAVRQVPELDSRVARRIFVQPLTGTQMRKFLPQLHPTLAATDDEVLVMLGRHAKGNLRNWARVLEVAGTLGIRTGEPITRSDVKGIIRSITGVDP